MEVLQSRTEMLEVIESVARAQGLKQHKITDVETNQKGEGYLGEIFMVKVKDDRVDKELNLIIKSAFKDNKLRDFVPVRMTFENEILFYSKIYPTFQKFERDRGIPRTIQLVPKCFEVSLDNEAELLVLENLKTQGFECFDKMLLLDHNHIKMIFEAYGRYHGYSYAYKDQHPEEFRQLASKTQNIFKQMIENPMFMETMNGVVGMVKALLVPGKDDEILSRFEKYEKDSIMDTFFKSGTSDCDHSVIVHGDCWSNNMMFKYEEIKRKPVDIRLIDWQLIKLGSPVCDLSYFLYSGGSKEIFDNLDYYLKVYHDTLSSFVKELGSNPEKVLPFSVLKDHWKIYSKYGIIMSFMLIKMKLTNKEEIIDLKDLKDGEDEENLHQFLSVGFREDLFSTRIRDLLAHTVEIGVL